jgi:hypothetical protein
MSFLTFFAGLVAPAVTPDAIRSEIYFLGSRHHGEALSGALAELGEPDLGPGRSRLLRAVVAQLKHERRRAADAPVP